VIKRARGSLKAGDWPADVRGQRKSERERKKLMLVLRMDQETIARLRALAKEREVSVAEIVRQLAAKAARASRARRR